MGLEDRGRTSRHSERDDSIIPWAVAIAFEIRHKPHTHLIHLARILGWDCDEIARASVAIVEHDLILLDKDQSWLAVLEHFSDKGFINWLTDTISSLQEPEITRAVLFRSDHHPEAIRDYDAKIATLVFWQVVSVRCHNRFKDGIDGVLPSVKVISSDPPARTAICAGSIGKDLHKIALSNSGSCV